MTGIKKTCIQSNTGLKAEFTNYGARLMSLFVPDQNGDPVNVCLGFKDPQSYIEAEEKYYGAIIGRYCNRIANATFTLEGESFHLAKNSGINHLHGGIKAFHTVCWDMEQISDHSVQFKYISPDGEEGYPGELDVLITYSLIENDLLVEIKAKADKNTIVNLTVHPYFNLKGEGVGDVLSHQLMIKGDNYLPVDQSVIPTGVIEQVADTAFDFREFRQIGELIDADEEQIVRGNGYDHTFVLNQEKKDLIKHSASVFEVQTGLKMDLYTTEPGLQFYSSNWLSGKDRGYSGKAYKKHGAFCLEPQHFPDSPNKSHFPSTFLKAGEIYQTSSVFKFSLL